MSIYCYGGTMQELKRIDESEFIPYSLQRLICMKKELKSVCDFEKRNKVPHAVDNCRKACTEVNKVIINKLSSYTNLNLDAIREILLLTSKGDVVTDIECADGITKVKSIPDASLDKPFNESKAIASYRIVDGFKDVNELFAAKSLSADKNELITESLINAIKPYIGVTDEEEKLFVNGKYTVDNLSILLNRSLSDMVTDRTGTRVTKMVVKFNDQIFSFNIRVHGDFVIVSQNDVINVFSVLKQREDNIRMIRRA